MNIISDRSLKDEYSTEIKMELPDLDMEMAHQGSGKRHTQKSLIRYFPIALWYITHRIFQLGFQLSLHWYLRTCPGPEYCQTVNSTSLSQSRCKYPSGRTILTVDKSHVDRLETPAIVGFNGYEYL